MGGELENKEIGSWVSQCRIDAPKSMHYSEIAAPATAKQTDGNGLVCQNEQSKQHADGINREIALWANNGGSQPKSQSSDRATRRATMPTTLAPSQPQWAKANSKRKACTNEAHICPNLPKSANAVVVRCARTAQKNEIPWSPPIPQTIVGHGQLEDPHGRPKLRNAFRLHKSARHL